MKFIKSIGLFIHQWFQFIFSLIQTKFMTQAQKDEEIAALRSQLALFHLKVKSGKMQKPQPTPAFRQIWVLLSKFFPKWKDALMLFKPETVIGWHKTAFKFYWKRKSKKSGRPTISRKTIALIQQIHRENPLLSPEKIHERLVDMNVLDAPAPNTIAKYIKNIRKASSEKQKQSWKTFLKNHRKDL